MHQLGGGGLRYLNRRLWSILFLAFVIASGCSYLVYRIAGRHPVAQSVTTKIIVPARDLQIGTIVKESDLSAGEWVGTRTLPKGMLVAKDAVVGRGVVSYLYQGEPIVDSRLAPAGSGGGLAATIKPGMRACAIRVDDVVGVAGFVLPGMRVDVLVSGNGPGVASNDGPKVKTLLQNIEVLSAGTNIQKDNEGKPVSVQVVNLLVTPEQAELLSLASAQTKLQLVLRNPLDIETPKTQGIGMASIFSDGTSAAKSSAKAEFKKPTPVMTPPRVLLVEVINGSKRIEEKFAESHQ